VDARRAPTLAIQPEHTLGEGPVSVSPPSEGSTPASGAAGAPEIDDLVDELVAAAGRTSVLGRILALHPWALRTWRSHLVALRALPTLTIELDGSPDADHMARVLGRRVGPLRCSRAMSAMDLPSSFDEYLATRRRTGAVRESIRRGRNLDLESSSVMAPAERADNLLAVLGSRAWDGDILEKLARESNVRPEQHEHLVCRADDGTPLAVAVMAIVGTTAMLTFSMATLDRSMSSIARYRVSAQAVERAIDLGATVLLGDPYLVMPAGLRQFSHALGFSPHRVDSHRR